MDPFLPKKETEYVDDIFVKKTIKEKLNKPRKEVKFTWEGLKNFVPFLETNPFDPLKVKRIKELTEGAPAKEKDYIEGYEEIEKALYGGVQDLGYSVSSLLTEGIDAAFDTKYLDALDKAYDENKIKDPETLLGTIGKLGVQFGIPSSAIIKVGARARGIAKGREALGKFSTAQKISSIGKRAGYMAGTFAAVDFLASPPDMPNLVLEKESEEGKSGRDLALTRFKNRIRFGAEGAALGFGFSLLGKPARVAGSFGVKYGLFKPIGLGIRAVDAAVVTPLSWIMARTPGLPQAQRGLRTAGAFTVEKLMNPILSRNFKFKQLPKFEDWRLFSTKSKDPLKARLKKLDNFLAAFRSVGKYTGLGYQLTAEAKREIKARSKTINKWLESVEFKAYNLAKSSKDLYNTSTTSPASMDYYLDQVLSYLKGQKKLSAMPEELRTSAHELNKELIKTKKTFGELLPEGELKDYILNNVKGYMRKSFSIFTNPEYNPPKEVYNKAVDWVMNNVVKKNKDLKEAAKKSYPNQSQAAANKTYAESVVSKILQDGKQNAQDPLKMLQRMTKEDLVSDDLLKTGEELPTAIKRLLGDPDALKGTKDYVSSLKSSVLQTASHAITQSANKKMFDRLADIGQKEGWLFKSRAQGIGKEILDISDRPIGEIKGLGLLKSNISKLHGSKQVLEAVKGTPGTLDSWIQNDIYRNILQFKVATQFGKTVLSPATQVRNVTSASMFPLANGHIGGRSSVTEAFKMTLDDIFGAGKVIDEAAFIKNIENKIRLGVLDENIYTAELKAVLQDIKSGAKVKSMDSLLNKMANNRFIRKATQVYAGGDNVWKWYGHEYVKSQMKSMYNTVDDIAKWTREITGREFQRTDTFTGARKTFDEALDEAAAWQIRNMYPTYSKVPQFVQNIRKLPFGNFVSFPAEMIRTTANILNIASKEAASSDPLLRQIGYRRMMGTYVTLGGASWGASTIAQNLTGVTMEQIEAYKRSLSAPWNSRATIIPLDKWKDGVGKAINFSYFSPYDVVVQPIEAFMKTLQEGQMNDTKRTEILWEMISPFGDGPIAKTIQPFISEAIALEKWNDVAPAGFFTGGRGGETKTGAKVYSDNDEIGTKIAKSWAHMWEGIQPGAIRTAGKLYKGAIDDVTKSGRPVSLRDEALALLSGIRIINVDVPQTMQYKISEYNRGTRAVTETETMFNLENWQTRGPEVLANEFRAIQDENYRVNREFYRVLQDAMAVGVPRRELKKILRKRGLSQKRTNLLFRGQNIPYTGYDSRMKKRVKDAEKIGKELGKNKSKDFFNYFYPRRLFRLIEREYRKSLVPEEKVDRSIIDRVTDYFSEQLPSGGGSGGGGPELSQRIQTPPLPATSMPAPNLMGQSPQKINGLTRSEQALLSPEEKIIAART
jgi:hypothetical protein